MSEKMTVESNKSFWSNVKIICYVVCGVLFIENEISKTIKEILGPIKTEQQEIKKDLLNLKEGVLINTHDVGEMKQFFREFIKPNETQIQKQKR